MKHIQFSGRALPMRGDDIDTDRIIPARFLKEITFEKMGEYLFYDARFNDDHSPKNHLLNDPIYKGSSFLIVGQNFGCGSSREHAPQAIKRYGFDVIIGESFAEIFAGNCKSLGVPAVTLPRADIETLWAEIEANPQLMLHLNLETKQLIADDSVFEIDIVESRRVAFLEGTWDSLGLLKQNKDLVQKKAQELPYLHFGAK